VDASRDKVDKATATEALKKAFRCLKYELKKFKLAVILPEQVSS
jgi:hypothetical protein